MALPLRRMSPWVAYPLPIEGLVDAGPDTWHPATVVLHHMATTFWSSDFRIRDAILYALGPLGKLWLLAGGAEALPLHCMEIGPTNAFHLPNKFGAKGMLCELLLLAASALLCLPRSTAAALALAARLPLQQPHAHTHTRPALPRTCCLWRLAVPILGIGRPHDMRVMALGLSYCTSQPIRKGSQFTIGWSTAKMPALRHPALCPNNGPGCLRHLSH